MPTISKQQPMRPAEIDLVDQVNTNTGDIETNRKNLAQEVTDRTNADTALGNRITTETNERKDAEQVNATAISDETTRAKAAEEANAQNITNLQNRFPIQTDDIGDLQVSNAKLAENAVTTDRIADKNVTTDKLEDSIQQQLTFLQTVPAMEFGTSNSVDVSANSNATVDITFGSVKTEAPVVLCGLQHESGNLACIVSGVTNQQCSIIVYNLTSTDVTGVTVDYLAISGR